MQRFPSQFPRPTSQAGRATTLTAKGRAVEEEEEGADEEDEREEARRPAKARTWE
jgi:hypothetical protein